MPIQNKVKWRKTDRGLEGELLSPRGYARTLGLYRSVKTFPPMAAIGYFLLAVTHCYYYRFSVFGRVLFSEEKQMKKLQDECVLGRLIQEIEHQICSFGS